MKNLEIVVAIWIIIAVTTFGKFRYLHSPMGIKISPDIAPQEITEEESVL
jgi:abortive infection bacteriophage resistance protein